ncbi:MAG TPA: hypothetical protein VGM91_20180 [Conexibacter sp.]|jgi:hypothetical protein
MFPERALAILARMQQRLGAIVRRRLATRLGVAASLTLLGCGGNAASASSRGPATPQAAVERFLSVLASATPPQHGSEARKKRQVTELWRRMCNTIDPKLRSLRFDDDSRVDRAANCGSVVALLAMYTGENSGVAPVSAITGSVRSATTRGTFGFVSTAVRYRRENQADTAPVVVKILVVRRAGAWWVGPPQAVNPTLARKGGLSETQLRSEYTRLLKSSDNSR